MDALNICLPANADIADSYGLIGTQPARHLSRMGIYTNLFAIGKRSMASQDDELAAIVAQPLRPAMGAIFLGYPDGYNRHANPLVHVGQRIAITMFESSLIPAAWVKPLNSMDAVIVPSQFCRDVFVTCGVTAPIHVIPLGIGDIYRYAERERSRPLTFLAFLDRGRRKGGVDAVHAFVRAFGDSKQHKLVLKTRQHKVPLAVDSPNIEVIQQDMSEAELYQLYLSCDVLINPNKGEGFGLIPREFAATGGLSLATNWGGTADDIYEWGLPISCSLERAWQGNKSMDGQDLGVWAKPDVDRLATKLLSVAYNRDYYRQLGQTMAARARALYSWQTFAEQVLTVWREVAIGERFRLSAFAA